MSPIDVFISYPHSKEGEHRVLNPGEHFEKEFSERNCLLVVSDKGNDDTWWVREFSLEQMEMARQEGRNPMVGALQGVYISDDALEGVFYMADGRRIHAKYVNFVSAPGLSKNKKTP